MECQPYRQYSVLRLAASIFSVGIGGLWRCLNGRPTVIDLECVEQIRLFALTTLRPAFTTTALYAVFLTYVFVVDTRAPAAFETLRLAGPGATPHHISTTGVSLLIATSHIGGHSLNRLAVRAFIIFSSLAKSLSG